MQTPDKGRVPLTWDAVLLLLDWVTGVKGLAETENAFRSASGGTVVTPPPEELDTFRAVLGRELQATAPEGWSTKIQQLGSLAKALDP